MVDSNTVQSGTASRRQVMRIVYWVTTILFCAFYAFSVFNYVSQPEASAAQYEGLGYPGYLVTIMIFVKLAGIAAVLVRRPVGLAQLAYAGFFYHLILAGIAHVGAGVPGVEIAIVLFILMATSWATQNAARNGVAAYAPTRFGMAA